MPATLTRLELRRIHNARAAARRISRQVGGKLHPKEPLFYGRSRREERRSIGAYLRQQREAEQEMLAEAPDWWAQRHIWMQRRLDRLELNPRRMKALHKKLDADTPRALLGRAERRLAYHYDDLKCMEHDALMLRNCY